jgi:hypothetical protein
MSTALGIVLGALGSVAINTGNNLQSLGMAQLEAQAADAKAAAAAAAGDDYRGQTTPLGDGQEEAAGDCEAGTVVVSQPAGRAKEGEGKGSGEEKEEELDTCKSPVWVVGTVVFITGSLLNFVAFAFAPQSILASLEGIQFVTNVLFGKFVLGSDVSRSTPFVFESGDV